MIAMVQRVNQIQNSDGDGCNNDGCFRRWFVAIVLCAVLVTYRITPNTPRQTHVRHLVEHIWNEEEVQQLIKWMHDASDYPSTVTDSTSKIEDVGEAVPFNGSCPHPLMVPNREKTMCTFAARADIGRHYIQTGGFSAIREPYPNLVNRMMSFSRFFINNDVRGKGIDTVPVIKQFFESEKYKSAASDVCGQGYPVLDPFQLSVIIQLPGQQVPTHYDAPWFWGASRLTHPVWLLASMQASGLFKDITVPQLQGVSYLHDWGKEADELTQSELLDQYGGSFFYYAAGPQWEASHFAPRRGSAILLDGSKCVHGTTMFKSKDAPLLPDLPKESRPQLVNKGCRTKSCENGSFTDNQWDVVVNGTVVETYTSKQLRVSLVWRSRCFKTEDERKKFEQAPDLTIEQIFDDFKKDLIKKKKLTPAEADAITPMELGPLLLNVYMDYPLPKAVIPFNYCALPALLGDKQNTGIVASLLRPFCKVKF
eukprot:m.219434 g.219434  ORF g.219434 m.219434 type:complete len:481 (+) comp15111_c0_seq1:381-1823(+)